MGDTREFKVPKISTNNLTIKCSIIVDSLTTNNLTHPISANLLTTANLQIITFQTMLAQKEIWQKRQLTKTVILFDLDDSSFSKKAIRKPKTRMANSRSMVCRPMPLFKEINLLTRGSIIKEFWATEHRLAIIQIQANQTMDNPIRCNMGRPSRLKIFKIHRK